MLTSRTKQYSVTADANSIDGDLAVWVRPNLPMEDDFSDDELEALVVRGTIRELLADERRSDD